MRIRKASASLPSAMNPTKPQKSNSYPCVEPTWRDDAFFSPIHKEEWEMDASLPSKSIPDSSSKPLSLGDAFFSLNHKEEPGSGTPPSSVSSPNIIKRDNIRLANKLNPHICPNESSEASYHERAGPPFISIDKLLHEPANLYSFSSERPQDLSDEQANPASSREDKPLIGDPEGLANTSNSTVGSSGPFRLPSGHSTAPTILHATAHPPLRRPYILSFILFVGLFSDTVRNALPTSILHILDNYLWLPIFIFILGDIACRPIGVLRYLAPKANKTRLYLSDTTPANMFDDFDNSVLAPVEHKPLSLRPPTPTEKLPYTEKEASEIERDLKCKPTSGEGPIFGLCMLVLFFGLVALTDWFGVLPASDGSKINAELNEVSTVLRGIAAEFQQPA